MRVYCIYMLNFFSAIVHLDPLAIVQTGGYLGIAILIFAESGLFFGIFFPGDSLLFAAGLIAASGFFDPWFLIGIVVLSAIIGDSVGYWFGSTVGGALYERKDSRFFKQAYLHRTQLFYEKHGGRAVLLARFVPIVRTIAPILAGVSSMEYSVFIVYNILGASIWGGAMIALGFFLGKVIPNSQHYILPFSLLIIFVSFLPIILNYIKNRKAR